MAYSNMNQTSLSKKKSKSKIAKKDYMQYITDVEKETNIDEKCFECNKHVDEGVFCDECKTWWHYECQNTTEKTIELEYVNTEFICTYCKQTCDENKNSTDKKTKKNQIEDIDNGNSTNKVYNIADMLQIINNNEKDAEEKKTIIKRLTEENQLLEARINRITNDKVKLHNKLKEREYRLKQLESNENTIEQQEEKIKELTSMINNLTAKSKVAVDKLVDKQYRKNLVKQFDELTNSLNDRIK